MSVSVIPSKYLGKMGYTIYKDGLTPKEYKLIKDNLTVAPYIPKSPVQPEKYKIYLESQSKYYLPRYFGIQHFGEPESYCISKGDPIQVEFVGSLRTNQLPIVDAYLSKVNDRTGGGGLLDVPCGWGKTAMALYICSQLKVKTLVIVHKSFLVNQWIERIEEFLPSARIGKIQGKEIDIQNKDIVIGMLQSLSVKHYSEDTFTSFGFTIVDECHHISSEVFSQSLTRIVTKYTLGLSATMTRKDGLTHVFKMFLGDVVYAVKRIADDTVLVKTLLYDSKDDEFKETIYDHRGNPQYSTMITKICDYNERSEFILQVLHHELTHTKEQQIMILAQNKSILTYLYDAIVYRNLGSVGYYMGGMKESQLKESETKQIVVATYAMASEGLDIKTLTTLLFATPRTDITQSVGRILRVKHNRPLIVDILDTHDVFQRQYKKRLAYYKKNKYTVMVSDNTRYFTDTWNAPSVTKSAKCMISI
uniref:Helicase ATP-binding domain-containing protein n=1 Tax=viral metagenome TaxID=1070528 RepID=A0A6C0JWW5_9ZZZZ